MLGMSWWRFALLDAIGAALWVMVWVFAPAYFSEHLNVIVALSHHTKVVVSVSNRRWSDPGPCLFHSASSRTITRMVMAIPRRHAVFTHIRLATDVRST